MLPASSAKRFDDERGGEDYARCLLPVTQVAVVKNEIVGMIANTSGIVTGLYVDHRFRRNRIGSSLLHNACLKGADTLSVVSSNRAAISFYERCGWVRWKKLSGKVCGAEVTEELMVLKHRRQDKWR
ncbi:GNAT family N-acetyltransferase [Agrobacterium larrymoorei]|uniref:GNAT family N-acetyltransferase n=1 Tax=Agrobacterium larrymoorei TaxID=160699 RepID=UPI003B521DAF